MKSLLEQALQPVFDNLINLQLRMLNDPEFTFQVYDLKWIAEKIKKIIKEGTGEWVVNEDTDEWYRISKKTLEGIVFFAWEASGRHKVYEYPEKKDAISAVKDLNAGIIGPILTEDDAEQWDKMSG